ncbi:hypothetical protein M011DRAFT_525281 [Sporormia fimetaria CBS 119925]|uniref:Heterokaryon incompatibility domain-containing protein n=1 Tax=Sporormia fimetaria CBS 119925 TaxID=1340428 RepID=A0A6A6VDW3_9PLEO|nr:hypothetical protein M011DRAFT_525281 [Sporormia fimetaria CBS 119925]
MATTQTPKCPVCQDLLPPHFALSAAELVDSALGGCKWCLVIQRAVEWHRPIEEVNSIGVVRDGSLILYATFKEESEGGFHVELYSEADGSADQRRIPKARTVSPQRSLEASLSLIKRWLQDCKNKHPACGRDEKIKLPTRVVDVGASAEDVRLHVSNEEDAAYVALSHCWGTKPMPIRTLKDNLIEHQKSMTLPPEAKTFVDAAVVYDKDDWAKEAAKMSQIYQNATLTLSADGAEDVTGGLLPTEPPESTSAQAQIVQRVEVQGSDDASLIFYARLRALPPSSPHSFPHSSLSRAPSKLSTRGWVVQERILSPRMVHFYREEIVWSCYSQQRCECRLLPGAPRGGTFRHLLVEAKSAEKANSLTLGTSTELLFEWPSIVTEFTSKDLTYQDNRLPAISGLAGLMMQQTKANYLAGLWSFDMEYSLLWMSDHKSAKEPIQRIKIEAYAPSWSWASTDGPVKFIPRHLDQFSSRRSGDDEIDPIFRCVRAGTVPVTSNKFGPVKYSFVTVVGQFLPIFYDRSRKVWRPEDPDEPGMALADPRLEPKFVFDVASEFPDGGPPEGTAGYALLRAARYLWKGQWSTPSTEVVAILLALVSVDPIAFKRKGVVLHAFDAEKVWKNCSEQSLVLC